jgi:RHS repeat-associated protein
LFQGQLWTQETGLNDYRNRVELPTMGVFLQPDPIGFKGDAANIYRFCNNNAVNRSDPTGLFDIWKNLTNFFNGNPSLNTVLAAWNSDLIRSLTIAQVSSTANGEGQSGKPYSSASVRIEHDENFDVTKDPITYNNGQPANAKTEHHLGDPSAVVGPDGKIHFSQTLWSKTTFPVGASDALIRAEWKRVEAVRKERAALQSVAEVRSLREFRSAAEAQKVIGNATRHQYELWSLSVSMLFDGFNHDGGTR